MGKSKKQRRKERKKQVKVDKKPTMLHYIATAAITAGAFLTFYHGFAKHLKQEKAPGLFMPIHYEAEDVRTQANRELLKFPTKIEGARSVDKFLTPGAKYCLVHIRQMHETEEMTEEQKTKLEPIQKDLYQILTDLSKKGFDQVYAEGYTPEAMGLYKSLAGSELEERMKNEKSPELILEYKGKITLKPAETDKTLAEAIKYGDRKPSKERTKKVCDDREDALLEIITKQKKPTVMTTFGGFHSWGGRATYGPEFEYKRNSLKDNIEEWNKKHPDEKISLIEITPKKYQEKK